MAYTGPSSEYSLLAQYHGHGVEVAPDIVSSAESLFVLFSSDQLLSGDTLDGENG